jgi:hypothetical protein
MLRPAVIATGSRWGGRSRDSRRFKRRAAPLQERGLIEVTGRSDGWAAALTARHPLPELLPADLANLPGPRSFHRAAASQARSGRSDARRGAAGTHEPDAAQRPGRAGVASRRAAELLIEQGVVRVGRQVATLGSAGSWRGKVLKVASASPPSRCWIMFRRRPRSSPRPAMKRAAAPSSISCRAEAERVGRLT